ncbi:MAG TPA: fasciclin domain-containing protein [Thermoleophilaceae bacterium]|nr:fasciclin domain-containing protein [Thermoleophilaceae bacterium]
MQGIRALAVAATACAVVAAGAGAAAAGVAGEPTATAGRNIVETAVTAGKFDTLVSLVKKAGLARTLRTGGPYTVFAPTDAAFAKVPKSTLAALAGDRAKLRAVLLYHVASGRLTAAKVAARRRIRTLNGQRLRVRVRDAKVFVGGARVITPNVKASNGVIHAINKVLIPD